MRTRPIDLSADRASIAMHKRLGFYVMRYEYEKLL